MLFPLKQLKDGHSQWGDRNVHKSSCIRHLQKGGKQTQVPTRNGLGSFPTYQHLVHFNITAGSVKGVANCDGLKIRLFISTLKGTAFDWYVQLPANSIISWAKLEEESLLHFQEEDQLIIVAHFGNLKQGEHEPTMPSSKDGVVSLINAQCSITQCAGRAMLK